MKDRGEFYSNSIETLNDIIRQKDLELDFLREEVRRLKSGATVILRKSISETGLTAKDEGFYIYNTGGSIK